MNTNECAQLLRIAIIVDTEIPYDQGGGYRRDDYGSYLVSVAYVNDTVHPYLCTAIYPGDEWLGDDSLNLNNWDNHLLKAILERGSRFEGDQRVRKIIVYLNGEQISCLKFNKKGWLGTWTGVYVVNGKFSKFTKRLTLARYRTVMETHRRLQGKKSIS